MKNSYRIEGDVAYIRLNRRKGPDKETAVDLSDLPEIIGKFSSIHSLPQNKHGVLFKACGLINIPGVKPCKMLLHRHIMNAPEGVQVDHIDNNPLNNLRSNLRLVSNQENAQNQAGARENSMSGVRGVYYHKQSSKWRAIVCVNYSNKYLGLFDTIEEADTAVKAARAFHMPFSKEGIATPQPIHT